jgi:hypothetical protein
MHLRACGRREKHDAKAVPRNQAAAPFMMTSVDGNDSSDFLFMQCGANG